MVNVHRIGAFAMALAAAGCSVNSKVVVAEGSPSATATFVLDSDTTGVRGRAYYAYLIPENQCPASKKDMLGGKIAAESREELPAARIPAGSPIMIGVTYIDVRHLQNRECGYQAGFTPLAGQAYTLNFTTTSDGTRCGIGILDASGNAVAHDVPERVCLPSAHHEAKFENGVGHDIYHRVEVQLQ